MIETIIIKLLVANYPVIHIGKDFGSLKKTSSKLTVQKGLGLVYEFQNCSGMKFVRENFQNFRLLKFNSGD